LIELYWNAFDGDFIGVDWNAPAGTTLDFIDVDLIIYINIFFVYHKIVI
jgi:hypothetical protein